ncbi:MAG: DNA/RNA helicase domain-containing protein, partial [Lacunisphaera sp.]
KGRVVLRSKLEDHEAALILKTLEASYDKGCVIVALIGHNQFINSGEVGTGAWIHAAKERGWRCVVSDETIDLLSASDRLALHQPNLRERIEFGHLPHSLRYYRNLGIEKWAAAVLDGNEISAANEAKSIEPNDTVWLTRNLAAAKAWARKLRIGEERVGLIGSGKGVRLAAEGLFVSLKPSIADWMLSPDGDVRSSNSLETIQNQFQVQGLELDYTIVCWDLDLRREANAWACYAFNGNRWQRRLKDLAIAMNGYRVLLTRARRGMIIFVPQGDITGADTTRESDRYDDIAEYLLASGARALAV